jgi:hypothetical protein
VTYSATGGAVSATGLYTAGLTTGTFQVVAIQTGGTKADTSAVTVIAQSATAVPLALFRLDGGTGNVAVSNGIPLPPGKLFSAGIGGVRVLLGGSEVAAYVEVLKGKHSDGSARSVLVQFLWPQGGTSQASIEFNAPSVLPRRTKTPIVDLVSAAVALPTSPDYLVSTNVVGRTLTRAKSPTFPSFYGKYETDFDSWSNAHWTSYGSDWQAMNYYDRVLNHFAFWSRTGNPILWERAVRIAQDYRVNYLEANSYGSSEWWAQLEGLAIHYWLTGDERSREAVYKTAENLQRSRGGGRLANTSDQWLDNRVQAKVLGSKLLAMQLEAPSFGVISDWVASARADLSLILSTQGTDGSYRFVIQCGQSSNFMTGMLNSVYVQYYETFEPDNRLPGAIRKSLDWLWTTQWRSSALAFNYYSGSCPNIGDATPAADLNGLFLESWGWYYRLSGDAQYRSQGDLILQGGVQGAWVANPKQFNQHYMYSWRYLAYR